MADQIEDVKSKVDIVALISEYLELKKAGRNYKANCPFHGEKTPSFMVSPELQIYKCFGCGETGDVFTFLQRYEGMEFGEALKFLADRVGVKLTSYKPDQESEKEKIISVNRSAMAFYKYVLTDHPQGKKALEYLLNDRGLSLDLIKKFEIGYSPDSFEALPKYLLEKKKYNSKDLISSGIILQGRRSLFDRFGGRVIFPLFDHRGNPIGFAGRILPWGRKDSAKYINSPDTPAYHKSKVLYGLNITKDSIRDTKVVVMVEGELDMISSWNAGVKNVVAIKGSALTEDHVRLIKRFANKAILCLDSDFAGDVAAKKGAIIAQNMGLEVRVARLVGYKDPDDAAREDPKVLISAIENAVGIWDFLIDTIFEKYDPQRGDDKAKISTEAVPVLDLIEDKIVQAHYISLVAKRLSVPVEAVFGQIEKLTGKQESERVVEDIFKKDEKPRRQLLEERLLGVAFVCSPKTLYQKGVLDLVKTPLPSRLLEYFLKNYPKDSEKMFSLSSFVKTLPKELSDGFSDIVMGEITEEELPVVLKELEIVDLRHQLEKIGAKIASAEEENNLQDLNKYQQAFSDLAKTLSDLEGEE